MSRVLILMGVLAAILSACGPPEPGLIAEEQVEDDMRDNGIVR